jgi:hypothetical protein
LLPGAAAWGTGSAYEDSLALRSLGINSDILHGLGWG